MTTMSESTEMACFGVHIVKVVPAAVRSGLGRANAAQLATGEEWRMYRDFVECGRASQTEPRVHRGVWEGVPDAIWQMESGVERVRGGAGIGGRDSDEESWSWRRRGTSVRVCERERIGLGHMGILDIFTGRVHVP